MSFSAVGGLEESAHYISSSTLTRLHRALHLVHLQPQRESRATRLLKGVLVAAQLVWRHQLYGVLGGF